MLPFAFEDGMGYERYVDYALQVPMYFVKRGETYHDVAGADFRALLAGRLPQMPGERATMSDWANHLSTIFPEVRLKRFLEMRGGDVGGRDHIVAFSAFFVGLIYDGASLDAAWDLVKGWSAQQRQQLRDDVPTRGLEAEIGGVSLRDIAREALAISRHGLARRDRRNGEGQSEAIHLDLLDARVASGRVAAQDWLDRFHDVWGGDVDPVFAEAAF
jgi:glutamate--cysteine ligase